MFFIGNRSNRTVRIIRLMWQLNTRMQLRHTGMAITVFYFRSVKIIHKENSNFDLALQKRRFCVAKEPLLPCKTYAFGTQSNWFCKALIIKKLHNRYFHTGFLRYCPIFPVLSITYVAAFQTSANSDIFLYTMLAQEVFVLVFIAIKDVYINVAVYAADSPVRT